MHITKANKAEFNLLVTRAFKIAQLGKKFVSDLVRSLTKDKDAYIISSLECPQAQIGEYLLENMSGLTNVEDPVTAALTMIQKFFVALDVKIGSRLKVEFEELIKKMLQPTSSENVVSIWHQNTKSYDCICGRVQNQTKNGEYNQQICYKCGKICHIDCLWQRQPTDVCYECPTCYLLNCIPQKTVKEVIFLGYLRLTGKDRVNYSLKFFLDMKADQHDNVEIRCCRLNNKNKYEMAFPQNCNISISNRRLAEFRPLSINSPLKRRNDQEISINKFWLSYLNTITVQQRSEQQENVRILPPSNHLLMIVNIKPISKFKIEKMYLQRLLPLQQSKNCLKNYLTKDSNLLAIEKLTVSMKCQYYQTSIIYPARSKNCTTHYQPFDILNFITASINSRNSVQKWRCPICKKRAYDLYVDQYLRSLIKDKYNISDITFSLTDQPIIRQNDPSDEDLDEPIDKLPKKSIMPDKLGKQIDIDSLDEPLPISEKNEVAKEANQVIQIIDSDEEPFYGKRAHSQHTDSTDNLPTRKVSSAERDKLQNSNPNNAEQEQQYKVPSTSSSIVSKIKQRLKDKAIAPVVTPQPVQHSQLAKKAEPVVYIIDQQEQTKQKLTEPEQPNPNPPSVKTQKQLLADATATLKRNMNRSMTQTDQLIFNSICRKLLNFNISS